MVLLTEVEVQSIMILIFEQLVLIKKSYYFLNCLNFNVIQSTIPLKVLHNLTYIHPSKNLKFLMIAFLLPFSANEYIQTCGILSGVKDNFLTTFTGVDSQLVKFAIIFIVAIMIVVFFTSLLDKKKDAKKK